MGKIRTEGVGEVQEFLDIVRALVFDYFRLLTVSFQVRLCHRTLQDDERPRRGI